MSNRKSFSAKGRTPKKNPLEGISFDIDGEEFACHGHMSYLETSDMARRISDLPTTDLDDLRALDPVMAAQVVGSMSQTLLLALGDVEYARFRKYCRDNTIDDDVIVEVLAWINESVQEQVEEDTGRPTGPSPPSPNGQPATDGQMSPPGAPPDGEPPTPPGKQPATATIKTLGGKAGRRTA